MTNKSLKHKAEGRTNMKMRFLYRERIFISHIPGNPMQVYGWAGPK
jgi:hypothetical protein